MTCWQYVDAAAAILLLEAVEAARERDWRRGPFATAEELLQELSHPSQ